MINFALADEGRHAHLNHASRSNTPVCIASAANKPMLMELVGTHYWHGPVPLHLARWSRSGPPCIEQPMKIHPIKPAVFVKEMSAGRLAVREVRDTASASRVHLAWPGRGKAWKAAEVLSRCPTRRPEPIHHRALALWLASRLAVLLSPYPPEI